MIRCPACGNSDEFAIQAIDPVIAYVSQHTKPGPYYEAGDLEITDTKSYGGAEWDENSECRCLQCQYTEALGFFTVDEEETEAAEDQVS